MKMLRTSATAAGAMAHLVRSPRGFGVSPAASQGEGPAASSAPPKRGLAAVPASGGAVEISMSDDLAMSLRLGAVACGVDAGEFVKRAVAEKAAGLGLPALANARTSFVGVDLTRGKDCLAVASRDEAGDWKLILNEDGDLTDLPEFERAPRARFDAGGYVAARLKGPEP